MIQEKKNLKILQFCDNFYPQIDGVVKVVDNSTKILNERCEAKLVVPKYTENEFDDSVFSYETLRRETNSIHFKGIEIPLPKKTDELTEYITDYKADVYHVHSPFFVGRYALKLAKKNGVPVVATFHSQFKKDALSVTRSELIADAFVKNIVRFFNRCDEVWAPSKRTAEILRSYGYKKEIFIMENGTDFEYPTNIDELTETVRACYGIERNCKNLLFVGQIREVKNISLILQTLYELLQTDESYRLYLVGEGSDMPKYKEWAKKQGIGEKVRFLGKISDKRILAGIYAACDLFFFPSSYDNAPIVVREACVMKTPSLLSLGSAAAEPFTDGVNGYLAEERVEEMKRKIEDIFLSSAKMREIGERASYEVPITFEKMAERTIERYRVVIDRYKNASKDKKRTD